MKEEHIPIFIICGAVIFLIGLRWALYTPDTPESIAAEKAAELEGPAKLLFEKNGVKVYRFIDGGSAVYFSDSREVKILKEKP